MLLYSLTLVAFAAVAARLRAQRHEHVLGKDEVTGSNPVSSSKKTTIYGGFSFVVSTIYSGKKSAKNFGCQNVTLWPSKSRLRFPPIVSFSPYVEMRSKNALKRPKTACFCPNGSKMVVKIFSEITKLF